MSTPRVVAVEPQSPAERAGLLAGDEILAIAGEVPRDVIRWRILTDQPEVDLVISRNHQRFDMVVEKNDGEPLGAEVNAAVFDRVQTCDNHCEFCFVHQLPKGMRRSLYLKDDDYRLSFLYGNFTTLTRFTELDLERVITERLSPLHVSIHATDPDIRADILKNRRGAVSLRWLRALLDHDIEVHGQIVVCPGINDGDIFEDTMAGVLERFPELRTVCVVPLGVSKHSTSARMRSHTQAEAQQVLDTIAAWQELFITALGRRMVFAADEYYLMAGLPFPDADSYEGFPMHEDGVGMARTMELEFFDDTVSEPTSPRAGFFAWVDGAPADGYRSPRLGPPTRESTGDADPDTVAVASTSSTQPAVAVLTGTLGARIVEPLVASVARSDVRVIAVSNEYFGGNIGVTGLLVGEDIARVLSSEPQGHRYLLPDVCLSGGAFLDGMEVVDLPRPVEVVPTNGAALRTALEFS